MPERRGDPAKDRGGGEGGENRRCNDRGEEENHQVSSRSFDLRLFIPSGDICFSIPIARGLRRGSQSRERWKSQRSSRNGFVII